MVAILPLSFTDPAGGDNSSAKPQHAIIKKPARLITLVIKRC